jgi:branched-subunit amino acid transport protein
MSIATDWVSVATILAAGAVTVLARASFIVLPADTNVPAWLTRALKYVAAAVLPALILPDVLFRELPPGELINSYRLIAAMIAALIAWRTKSIFATLGAGMATLWLLKWLAPLSPFTLFGG